MLKNCTNYESVDCPKAVSVKNRVDDTKMELLFVGCWGVYCRDGEMDQTKYKKGKFDTKKVVFGGKSVAQGMSEYSKRINVDSLILAGDNIYSRNPTEEEMANPHKGLDETLYDMDLQLSEGFMKCFNEVDVKNIYVAIGNHDITNCDILNNQINFDKWSLPGLYYNVIYEMRGYKMNIMFIDTNLYDKDKTCNPSEYSRDETKITPENEAWLSMAINRQKEWMVNTVLDNRCEWNVIVGHIPFLYNPHKKMKDGSKFDYSVNKELASDISYVNRSVRERGLNIQLYLCADEHNQQVIKCQGNVDVGYNMTDLPAIIIAGSGGTDLDNVNESDSLNRNGCNFLTKKTHGFVGISVSSNNIVLNLHSSERLVSSSHTVVNVNRQGIVAK